MNKKGFLIIEVLIALSLVTFFVASFAYFYSQFTFKYNSLKYYSKDCLQAQNYFEKALGGFDVIPSLNIEIESYQNQVSKITYIVGPNKKLELLIND